MSKVVNKVWGSERHYKNDIYCVKLLTVKQGSCCSIHYHKEKTETFCACQGKVLLEIWETAKSEKDIKNIAKTLPKQRIILEPLHNLTLKDFSVITIEPLTLHRFTGLLDTINSFYEASTIDNPKDSYRIIESMGVYASL